MKNVIKLGLCAAVALAFGACSDGSKNQSQSQKVPNVKVEVPKAETPPAKPQEIANKGSELYKKCSGCHGADGKTKALGKSEVIAGWEKDKITAALKGYQDGSYGKEMKALMKGQVGALSDQDIGDLADYISAFK